MPNVPQTTYEMPHAVFVAPRHRRDSEPDYGFPGWSFPEVPSDMPDYDQTQESPWFPEI